MVYLPFCSWEMYSLDLVPSSRLNHTSSLLMVVMMALQGDTHTHTHRYKHAKALACDTTDSQFPIKCSASIVGYLHGKTTTGNFAMVTGEEKNKRLDLDQHFMVFGNLTGYQSCKSINVLTFSGIFATQDNKQKCFSMYYQYYDCA